MIGRDTPRSEDACRKGVRIPAESLHDVVVNTNLIASLGVALLAAGAVRVEASADPSPTNELCVMTFNLRYASATPPNAWSQRRPAMKACLAQYAPDLIGTQEGLYPQLKDLAADLPAHAWLGTGRDGGSRGEFMAIFYRRDRLDPLEYDHFWLSDTPDVIGSSTWGNTNRRMVTWVRFRDLASGREFYFWNTHLDHALQPAREKGAALIRQRIEALKTRLPVLLVGDFNAQAGANKAYEILVNEGGLQDAWLQAAERRNEDINSFHNFGGPKQGGIRIDWILGRGVAQVRASEIVTFAEKGQYPSDHFPVVAWLTLAP
jgi:endonuclease/exonuclease/phosphatase family metal-dependent hydrolase